MKNLLSETLKDIMLSNHSLTDIVFIGSSNGKYRCTWDEFAAMADRDYHSGFGAQVVATDLVIVFSDKTTMRREEYDGSEWWSYYQPFKKQKETKRITDIFADIKEHIGWCTIHQLNNDEG